MGTIDQDGTGIHLVTRDAFRESMSRLRHERHSIEKEARRYVAILANVHFLSFLEDDKMCSDFM